MRNSILLTLSTTFGVLKVICILFSGRIIRSFPHDRQVDKTLLPTMHIIHQGTFSFTCWLCICLL